MGLNDDSEICVESLSRCARNRWSGAFPWPQSVRQSHGRSGGRSMRSAMESGRAAPWASGPGGSCDFLVVKHRKRTTARLGISCCRCFAALNLLEGIPVMLDALPVGAALVRIPGVAHGWSRWRRSHRRALDGRGRGRHAESPPWGFEAGDSAAADDGAGRQAVANPAARDANRLNLVVKAAARGESEPGGSKAIVRDHPTTPVSLAHGDRRRVGGFSRVGELVRRVDGGRGCCRSGRRTRGRRCDHGMRQGCGGALRRVGR